MGKVDYIFELIDDGQLQIVELNFALGLVATL